MVGTIFEGSKASLVKWFFAIFLMSQSRNGVSACELQRQLGVGYNCAWRMAKAIRGLMQDEIVKQTGEIECDETWIGGKRRQTDPENKTIVFGSVKRHGRVQVQIIPDVSEESLLHPIRAHIEKGSLLLTDQWRAYASIANIEGLRHLTVNHMKREYRRGKASTNTIEGFWSLTKGAIRGTYHAVSKQYLPLYLAERTFSYNYGRGACHPFSLLLQRVQAGKRTDHHPSVSCPPDYSSSSQKF